MSAASTHSEEPDDPRPGLAGRPPPPSALVGLSPQAAERVRPHVRLAQLEVSVRRESSGELRADRAMVERASAAALASLREVFSSPPSPWLHAVAQAAAELGLPLIAGWDATRGAVKAYANASDASEGVRRALARRLGLDRLEGRAGPEGFEPCPAPHVVGVNASARGEELKLYRQAADAEALARPLGAAARELAARARGAGSSGGAVLSLQVASRGLPEPGSARLREALLVPRAFFVALREAPGDALARPLGHLPGFRWAEVCAALPFTPASPRSIGIEPGAPHRWTVYAKPLAAGAPAVHRLEPVAAFACRLGGEPIEVAVHVEPAQPGRRSYAEVRGLSVSYRLAEGRPPREPLCALMDWAVERIGAAPIEGAFDAARGGRPPPPWRRSR